MEWTKSRMSDSELERRRREYMEAAMSMSRRAVPDDTETSEQEQFPEPVRETVQEAPAPEIVPEAPAKSETADNPEEPEKPEEPAEQEEPEKMQEPQELEEEPVQAEEQPQADEAAAEEKDEPKPEKKTFGVFDIEEFSEAVRNGEMDGEKLKEAAEILEEMSGKTKEMERLAQSQTVLPEQESVSTVPKSLNSYVERHNNGGCQSCGQNTGRGQGSFRGQGTGRGQGSYRGQARHSGAGQ